MDKTVFLTIYATFENLKVVQKTLPSIIKETKRNDAKLIVHDSSVKGKAEKWTYLQKLNKNNDFFLILSDNISMAHTRNMCLALGQELYAPEYICMIEDDHGFKEGLIKSMIEAMKKYYGKPSPNGLKYGLFTGCGKHHEAKRHILEDGHAYPDINTSPSRLGGVNSCFRCAPTTHWNTVLKGYDTDEYPISFYQTGNLNFRNYNKGFSILIVDNGAKVFDIEDWGRGTSSKLSLKLWDSDFTASDPRSHYLGNPSHSQLLLDNNGNKSDAKEDATQDSACIFLEENQESPKVLKLHQENLQLQEENQRLHRVNLSLQQVQESNDLKQTAIEQLKKEIAQVRENNMLKQTAIEQLQKEIAQVRENNMLKQTAIEQLQKEIAQVRENNQQLQVEIQQVRENNQQLHKENQDLKQDYYSLQQQNQQLKQDIEQLQQENQQVKHEIHQIRNSLSLKITAPLRKVYGMIRKLE
ncbi:MAG: hypothetical protein ACE5KZ_08505 [Candidatus Scalinduaceae bacterium]